jgi:hypothetical protein
MNEQTKHTPGPWQIDKFIGEFVVSSGDTSSDPNAREICECYQDGERQDKTDLANARLIAAAPDLLTTLKFGLSITNDLTLSDADIAENTSKSALFIRMARAAIAKATQT